MKTTLRVWLSIGGGLLVIGLIISIIGGVLWRFNPKNRMNFVEQNRKFSAADIDNIKTDITNRSIEVVPTNDDTISISYYTSDKYDITCEQVGSTVELMHNPKIYVLGFLNFDFSPEAYKVYINVPVEYMGSLNLKTSNAKIAIEDFVKLSDVKVKSTNGKIEINDITAKNVDVKTTNGKILISDTTSESRVSAHTTNGAATFSGCSAKGIDITTTNGTITITKSVADDIRANSTNAKITVEHIESSSIDLITSNGAIAGTIVGKKSDYNIDTSTTNGSCNPTSMINSNAENELKALTRNGNINLSFE